MKVNNKEKFDKQNIFGMGEANTAFADYFIGNSFLNPLTHPGECAVFLANVTFEPGCRNNWHIHHAKRREVAGIKRKEGNLSVWSREWLL